MSEFYKLISHTADLGIEVQADSIPHLYINSARALFDLIAGLDNIEKKRRHLITADGLDAEDLLISFLNELIFLFATRKYLFSHFEINNLSSTQINAVASGEEFNPGKHRIIHEIKAATYHDLHIKKENGYYIVRIIFDV